jgi:ABC-2 type transport system ATP-binding protein
MFHIRNLSFAYPNQQKLLKNLSMTFIPGRVNVILGLNGAGKTTLFDLISGVLPKAEGLIHLPLENEILYQLQGIPFLTNLKGKDLVNLILKADFKNKIKVIMPDHITLTDEREKQLFAKLWNTRYGDMSLGERRWLMVSLMCELNRQLYLFDEPTSGVDPHSRLNILKRMERLSKRDGTIVILSTHNLHELEYIDCQLFLLHEGSLLFDGSYRQFVSAGEGNNPDAAFNYYVFQDKEKIYG